MVDLTGTIAESLFLQKVFVVLANPNHGKYSIIMWYDGRIEAFTMHPSEFIYRARKL